MRLGSARRYAAKAFICDRSSFACLPKTLMYSSKVASLGSLPNSYLTTYMLRHVQHAENDFSLGTKGMGMPIRLAHVGAMSTGDLNPVNCLEVSAGVTPRACSYQKGITCISGTQPICSASNGNDLKRQLSRWNRGRLSKIA